MVLLTFLLGQYLSCTGLLDWPIWHGSCIPGFRRYALPVSSRRGRLRPNMAGTLDPFGLDDTDTAVSNTLPANADDMAELALWRRATGQVTERTVMISERGQTVTERKLPPDPRAAQAWLQARRPGTWGALAQGIQAAVTINLIGVDRAKHVKVARVIEHESPKGGPIATPGEGDAQILAGGECVLEDPSTPDTPVEALPKKYLAEI